MSSDLYSILQVAPNAEQEVIDAAYRRLAQKYHPDVNKSAEAIDRMKSINAAYHVLGDPVRRAQYDWNRQRGRRPRPVPPGPPEAAPEPFTSSAPAYTRRPAAPPEPQAPPAAEPEAAPRAASWRVPAFVVGLVLLCVLATSLGALFTLLSSNFNRAVTPTSIAIVEPPLTPTITQPQLIPTLTGIPTNTPPRAVDTAVPTLVSPTSDGQAAAARSSPTRPGSQTPAAFPTLRLPPTARSGPVEYQTNYFAFSVRGGPTRVKAIQAPTSRAEAQGTYFIVPVRWRNTSLVARPVLTDGPWTCIVNASSVMGCQSFDSYATGVFFEAQGATPPRVEPGQSADGWLVYDMPVNLPSPALRLYFDSSRSQVISELTLTALPVASSGVAVPETWPAGPTPGARLGCSDPGSQITAPGMNAGVSNIVQVRGTANRVDLASYKVQYRTDADAYYGRDWGMLREVRARVVNSVLMEWVTSTVPPGGYWLRLLVIGPDGNYLEPCEVRVIVH